MYNKDTSNSSLDILYCKPYYDVCVYSSNDTKILIARIPSVNAICIFNTNQRFVENIKYANTKGFDYVYQKISTYKICTVLYCYECDNNRMTENLKNFIGDAVKDLDNEIFTAREKTKINLVEIVRKIDRFVNEFIVNFAKNVI